MIRKDREVTDFEEILEIIERCDVCRLALNGTDGYPYVLPLNFGYRHSEGRLTLYFHSALKGAKHELIGRDNRATFEMDCGHELFSEEERGYCTMNYESVIGRGRIEYVKEKEDKLEALTLLIDRYHSEHFAFNPAALPRTSVYKLIIEEMTAKRKASRRKTSQTG